MILILLQKSITFTEDWSRHQLQFLNLPIRFLKLRYRLISCLGYVIIVIVANLKLLCTMTYIEMALTHRLLIMKQWKLFHIGAFICDIKVIVAYRNILI